MDDGMDAATRAAAPPRRRTLRNFRFFSLPRRPTDSRMGAWGWPPLSRARISSLRYRGWKVSEHTPFFHTSIDSLAGAACAASSAAMTPLVTRVRWAAAWKNRMMAHMAGMKSVMAYLGMYSGTWVWYEYTSGALSRRE
jgi:hypothetical protein